MPVLCGGIQAWGKNVIVWWVFIYPGAAHGLCGHVCARKKKSGTTYQLAPMTTNKSDNNKTTLTTPSSSTTHTNHNTWPLLLLPLSGHHHLQLLLMTHNHTSMPWHDKNNVLMPHQEVNEAGEVHAMWQWWWGIIWWWQHMVSSLSTLVCGCASSGESAQPCPPIPLVDSESRCHVTDSNMATKQQTTTDLSFIIVIN